MERTSRKTRRARAPRTSPTIDHFSHPFDQKQNINEALDVDRPLSILRTVDGLGNMASQLSHILRKRLNHMVTFFDQCWDRFRTSHTLCDRQFNNWGELPPDLPIWEPLQASNVCPIGAKESREPSAEQCEDAHNAGAVTKNRIRSGLQINAIRSEPGKDSKWQSDRPTIRHADLGRRRDELDRLASADCVHAWLIAIRFPHRRRQIRRHLGRHGAQRHCARRDPSM